MSTRETELFHYGIKGMHWGIRRYQNQDGSYTQAGVARYNKAKAAKKDLKTTSSYDKKKEVKQEYKAAKKNLKSAVKADTGKELSEKGETAGTTVVEGIGKQVVGTGSAVVITNLLKNVGGMSAGKVATSAAVNVGATVVNSMNANNSIWDYKSIKEYNKRKNA